MAQKNTAEAPIIVGAGLSGLIAAHVFQRAKLLEAAPEPSENHSALLRFRTEAVSQLTGVPFRRVTVHKGMFSEGRFVQPNPKLCNQYSRKALNDAVRARSAWDLRTVERFVAPEDFHTRLVERLRPQITYNQSFDFRRGAEQPVINTAPLPAVLKAMKDLGFARRALEWPFQFSEIKVERYRIPNCDVHQTVYFPDGDTEVYRASITGDVLIVESTHGLELSWEGYSSSSNRLRLVLRAFGLPEFPGFVEQMESRSQRFGKVRELPADQRRSLLSTLTAQHGIFSLGRFATWRNVLLDDVVQDARVIQRLMSAGGYEASLLAARRDG